MKRLTWTVMVAALLASACGGSNPEVWLKVEEDGSRPCLGASHLRVKVNMPGQQPEVLTFDEFGVFFNTESFGCAIINEFRFPDLPLGKGVTLELSLSDSSTEDKGILSVGTSIPFDVKSGSPIQEVVISLYRRPGVQEGTLVVKKPADWGNISGIQSLQFRVTKEGETTPTRAYYLTYDPETRPDPFPLLVSNLPAPEEMELYHLLLEGMDANNPPNVLRAWQGRGGGFSVAWGMSPGGFLGLENV